ncbi:MAG: Ppx/GppA phosphatase family protein [Phormidesmis sp.]
MKLAAIDIGTNSIHMVVVKVVSEKAFEVIDREKEMVKLGRGVFATNRLSDRAFSTGLDTIERYAQLADQLGVDDIITVATSATREAQNGEAFLEELARRTKIVPRIISGKEEARLIFLAVRNAIALENETALVLDIGGGSTEAVVGNQQDILFGTSLKLGVLRLLDMIGDQKPLGKKARGILEAHIQVLAKQAMANAKQANFTQIIGTSGTIRTLGEAAYLEKNQGSLGSVNAEIVSLTDLQAMTDRLVDLKPDKRGKIDGISDKRTDAIHLGGVLLTQLLQMAGATEITLCDASLREGMILDYLERHPPQGKIGEAAAPNCKKSEQKQDLRHRKAARLVSKYGADWESNTHIAKLALQLFDQTEALHGYGDLERSVLEYAALMHDIGQYISFRGYHKNSRYILERTDPRGFTDEEMLLIGHVIRYHRKANPKTKHKKFKRLSDSNQQIVWMLAGLLRTAIGLDRSKSQLVSRTACEIEKDSLKITIFGSSSGSDGLEIELWAAMCDRHVLEKAIERPISIQAQ